MTKSLQAGDVVKSCSSIDVGDISDETFHADYTDSITSTNSGKPLLKPSPIFSPKLHIGDQLWEVKEEDDDMLERRSILSGLLEKPAFMKAISCESLRSSNIISQACKSALRLSLDKGISSIDSLPKVKITETIEKVPRQSFKKRFSKNLRQMTNVIVLSFGTMIAYSSFLAVRNLQSSLNTKGGLGLISLAVGYSMYMPGSIFAPFIVKVLRPKRSIIIALSFQAIFVFMNLYPSFYTLLPSCLLVGFGNALFWVSISSYLVFSAKACAESTKKVLEFVLTRFYGTFFLIYQLNNLPGNILSSLILFSGLTHMHNANLTSGGNFSLAHPHNATLSNASYITSAAFDVRVDDSSNCGVNFDHRSPSNLASVPVDEHARNILIGSLGAIDVLGILLILLFVKPVKTYKAKVQLQVIKHEVKMMLATFGDSRYRLIIPLLLYTGLQMAFFNGDVIKAFITCPLGIQMVGYLCMGFGLSTSISSYATGLLNKHIGRQIQIIAGYSVNIGLLIFMLSWQPTGRSALAPSALMFCLWGVADGVWNSQMNGLIGVVFVEKAESANACFRLLQGLGVSMAYASTQLIDMPTKIYIIGSLATVGVIGYCAMEWRLKRTKGEEANEVTV